MPRRGNPFQSLVRELHRGAESGSVVRESVELADRATGQLREIDIVIEFAIHGYPVVVCVECTATKRPADVTWVEQMIQKHDDLPTSKLVLVSAAGFSARAKAKAAAKDVDVLHLEDLGEVTWTTIVGKKDVLLLQSLRATMSVHLTSLASEEWPGPNVSKSDVLVRDDLEVPVERVVNAMLARTEILEVALSVSADAEGKGCTIEIHSSPGLRVVNQSGRDEAVDIFRVVFIPRISQHPIEMQSGILRGSAVAFGGFKGGLGREVDISVIEEPGGLIRGSWTERKRNASPRTGSFADPIVAVLDQASNEDIRRLFGN